MKPHRGVSGHHPFVPDPTGPSGGRPETGAARPDEEGPLARPGYTPAVPAERIAENLADLNWTVLTGLATGSLAVVVVGRLWTDATRGYLAFVAFCAFLIGLLALASDGGLPIPTAASPIVADPAWTAARGWALTAFCGLAFLETVALARGRRAPLLGGLALTSAAAVLALGALSWGGSPLGSALLLLQLVTIAAAIGGALAAMVLGHWYLVTPKLPEAPLVRFATVLTAAIAAQVVLFVIFLGLGAGPSGTPGFGALTGPWALFVWLRLLVGLVFPLIVSWGAVLTARTRSMESATGLLYIDLGTIAAGTILAAGLYFGAGILV
jgi:hypothetical protein